MTASRPPTSRASRWARVAVPVLGVVVVAAIVLGLWVRRDSDEPTATVEQYAQAYVAVCDAARLATDGSINAAYNTFFDDAHTVLHALAAEAATEARAETATLLETKNRVETALSTSTATLPTDLDALAAATRATLLAIGEPDPGACS